MMTLNGLVAVFFAIIMIYGLVNPSDWRLALLSIPVEIHIVWPLSILTVIYFSYVFFNKTITKVQKRLAIVILLFSVALVFIGLVSL